MLGLKLNHVSKRGHRNKSKFVVDTVAVAALITMSSNWERWRLKSPASPLLTQPLIQAQIKENIKAPRHWPLCGNSPLTGEFPAQMASNAKIVSIWWRHHVSTGRIFAGTPTFYIQYDENGALSIQQRNHLNFKYQVMRTTVVFMPVLWPCDVNSQMKRVISWYSLKHSNIRSGI